VPRFGVALRSWLQCEMSASIEDWLYEGLDADGRLRRHRHLDLSSLFNVIAFQRSVRELLPPAACR
jgi:hypothetical protein